MIMLRQATRQALEIYQMTIESLPMHFPEAWHLIYTVDDGRRCAHIVRVKVASRTNSRKTRRRPHPRVR